MIGFEKIEVELTTEYEKFLRTKAGEDWVKYKKKVNPPDKEVDFGDYLYDFYPEYLM